jgi:MFS family permease
LTFLKTEEINRSLTLSIKDGFFASIYATLTGGVFLTGFALSIGANELHIGIIAAIPLLGNLFQFIGAYLVNKKGRRKPVSVNAANCARSIWILVILLPFALKWYPSQFIIISFLTLIAIGHFFGAISGVAWLSWISDLVPETIRGRFFGKRNMIIGSAVLTFTIIGGRFLDYFDNTLSGFQILFFIAVIAGAISLKFLREIPETNVESGIKSKNYFRSLSLPFQDPNFRILLLFTMVWSFSVNLAGPFFVVYKLKELQLSYTYVAFLISLTSFSDLLGMRFWGHFSDKVGNRPLMLMCSIIASSLPFGWLLTSNNNFSLYLLFPFLHVMGGFFWAGMNLASVNLLFRLAPQQEKAVYFSAYASVNGIFAATASLGGGILGLIMVQESFNFLFINITGLKIVFLISGLMRCSAIPLLRQVYEPKGMSFDQAVRVIRSIRSINSTQGFNPLLHFFTFAIRKSKSYVENGMYFEDYSLKNLLVKLKDAIIRKNKV